MEKGVCPNNNITYLEADLLMLDLKRSPLIRPEPIPSNIQASLGNTDLIPMLLATELNDPQGGRA